MSEPASSPSRSNDGFPRLTSGRFPGALLMHIPDLSFSINRVVLRYSPKLTVAILAGFAVVHAMLETRILSRGIALPSAGECLEMALTFPVSVWPFFFGPPQGLPAQMIYYSLVIINAFLLSALIQKECRVRLARTRNMRADARQKPPSKYIF